MTELPTQALDPVLDQLLNAVPMHIDLSREGVDAARTRLRNMAAAVGDPFPQVATSDHDTQTGLGVRVYQPPSSAGRSPVVFFCHGGGFALGDLDTYDPLCKRIAVGCAAIVVSVDYRRAPEHRFPTAVDDAWAGLLRTAEHAADFGGDVTRMAIAGDSAGGNLAAVLSQRARDAGGPSLRFQLLWYPTTTCDYTWPSMTENAEAPLLDLAGIKTFIGWYAPDVDLSDPPAALAPARAESLADLPPAFVGIAGHDPLRDDGAHYASLLAASDVPVTLHMAGDLIHGYAYFAGIVPAATEALDISLAAMTAALHS